MKHDQKKGEAGGNRLEGSGTHQGFPTAEGEFLEEAKASWLHHDEPPNRTWVKGR